MDLYKILGNCRPFHPFLQGMSKSSKNWGYSPIFNFQFEKRCGVSLDKLSREITNNVTGDDFC